LPQFTSPNGDKYEIIHPFPAKKKGRSLDIPRGFLGGAVAVQTTKTFCGRSGSIPFKPWLSDLDRR